MEVDFGLMPLSQQMAHGSGQTAQSQTRHCGIPQTQMEMGRAHQCTEVNSGWMTCLVEAVQLQESTYAKNSCDTVHVAEPQIQYGHRKHMQT